MSFIPDVSDIAVVVNYDYPSHSEDYIHRIGRTARGDKSGKAYTFMTEKNAHKAKDLIDVLKESKQIVNPELYKLVEKASSGGGGGGFRGQLVFDRYHSFPLCVHMCYLLTR